MNFLNQDLMIFDKGNYESINREFMIEMNGAVRPLLEVQKKNIKSWIMIHCSMSIVIV